MIESVNNEKIKEYAKLNEKKYRDLTGLFIVEGEHLVLEVERIGLVKDIFSLDGSKGIKVSENVMRKLSNLNSVPNILAVCYKRKNEEIKGNILILDNIQDPGNLGTIIRSAVAFNIDTIIASKDTVDVYNTKVLRASEGMFFNINYIIDDLERIIPTLTDYEIYTTNVNNGKDISTIKKNKKYAIIMGNEGNGVRENIASLAKQNIYIKMNSKCESLNVGVATSIILYELNKDV